MKNLDVTPARYRIGIDVGGTFTDFILADMTGGRLILHKEPSVPGDPSLAVERGTKVLLATHGADVVVVWREIFNRRCPISIVGPLTQVDAV